jgi:hypothetical protein
MFTLKFKAAWARDGYRSYLDNSGSSSAVSSLTISVLLSPR